MSDGKQTGARSIRLPREYVDRLTKPFAKFLGVEAAASAVLLLFTLAALLLSNSPSAHLYESAWETDRASYRLAGICPLIVTLAVFLGFVVGKPAGILTLSWLAVRSGITLRPPDLDWKRLAGGGLLAGIGFTMALFIASLAFSASLIDSAKLWIFLASVVSAVAGLALLSSLPRRAAHAGTLATDAAGRHS